MAKRITISCDVLDWQRDRFTEIAKEKGKTVCGLMRDMIIKLILEEEKKNEG